MLLVLAGEVRREPRAELSPRLDGSWSEVHEPCPGWPGQGYMKVTCHYGIVTPSRRDGDDVDLQEFRRVGRPVVLFQQVWSKLGWLGHRSEVVCKRCAAYPSHRSLDETLRLWPCCIRAAPWPPSTAHFGRAATGPWRPAPQHPAARRAPPPWMEVGGRQAVQMMPLPPPSDGHGAQLTKAL
jgi:hypothetical protein